MDSEPQPSRKRWLLIVALVVLAVAGLVWARWPKPRAPRPVLATVSFANGSRVEVLAMAVDTVLDDGFDAGAGVARPITGGFFGPFGGTSQGSSSGGSYRAQIHHRSSNDEGLLGTKIETPHSSFLLLVRGFDADGRPGKLAGEDQMGRGGAMNKVLTRVDLWSGEELGWQPMDGPWQPMADDPRANDPRAFCDLPIFPRQAARLRLRFTQKGQPPVELEVDNPQPVTATPWQAKDVLPVVKRAGETDVRLSVLPWRRDEHGRWSALPLAEAIAPEWHFQTVMVSVEDAFGNMAYPNTAVGLPPGNGAWRAKFQVWRGTSYPTPLSEASVVGEGEFVAVGQPVKLTPLPGFAAQYGSVSLEAEAKAGGGWSKAEEKHMTTLRFKGTMNGAGAAPRLDGSWRIYVDGKAHPGQTMQNGGGHSSTGSSYTMDFDVSWWGRLAPGTKFKLAQVKAGPVVDVEVTFDPPVFPNRAGKVEKPAGSP